MTHAERLLTLPAHDENSRDPAIATLLGETKATIGMVPNLYSRLVNVPALLTTYKAGYAGFSASDLSPIEQQVVLLAISRFHRCEYCVAGHTMAAKMAKAAPELVEALRAGEALPDPKLNTLAEFTRAMVERRGLPTAAELEAFLDAGYRERDVLLIVLAIATKTISNFTNHLFNTPVDAAFAGCRWDDPDDA